MANKISANQSNLSHEADHGQNTVLQALIFIAQDEGRLERFITLTGLDLSDLRARASDSAFQAGVLDYILSEDQLVLDFAAFADIKPLEIQRLRHRLPGAYHDA